MTMISSDTKQVLMPEAERLGYEPPVMSRPGHLVWHHPATGQRVIVFARINGRAIKNARAALRRGARVDRQPRNRAV